MWKMIEIDVDGSHTGCDAYVVLLHQRMITATIALLLNLALSVQPANITFPFAIASALVKKQGEISHTTTQCFHVLPSTGLSRVSLFQQKNTPYTGQHLQDWRNRLQSELESQGQYQKDAIVRSVAQICQDLETRCNTVEDPLRRERQRAHELEGRVTELSARVASLEVEATDDRLHLEGLEDEKMNVCDERDNLRARLESLNDEYEEASRKANDTLSKTHEEYNAREMELRSTILTSEEYRGARERIIEVQNDTLRKLKEDLEQVRSRHSSLSEDYQALQHLQNDAEEWLKHECDVTSAQSKEIAALKDRNIELELQLQGTESELDVTTSRLSELQVSHQELKHSSEEAYTDLEAKHSSDLDAAVAKAKEETEMLGAQLREALQRGEQMEEAHNKTRQDLETAQVSIPLLEDRIQDLEDFCSEREKELVELRDMRRKMLASLKIASQHPLAIRPATRTQESTTKQTPPHAPREHRSRKSAIQTLQGTPKTTRGMQELTSTAMETLANASFASSDSHSSQNGSTPKRPKPRPASKVPAMQTSLTQKSVLSTRSVAKKLSPTKRSALRQLSPNRRHTTVGFTVSDNDEENANELRSVRKRRGSLQGIEEAEFDMEYFLAGTPLTPGNFTTGTGRLPDDDDMTVTEL